MILPGRATTMAAWPSRKVSQGANIQQVNIQQANIQQVNIQQADIRQHASHETQEW